MRLALPVKKIIEEYYPDMHQESRQSLVEKRNILTQLQNIQTYPFVAKALKRGEVLLHGWYYYIGSGSIYAYNPKKDIFEEIKDGKTAWKK